MLMKAELGARQCDSSGVMRDGGIRTMLNRVMLNANSRTASCGGV